MAQCCQGNITLRLLFLVGMLLVNRPICASAQAETPIHGHYPPGQTGLRGAAFPAIGWSFVNFSRLFSNLKLKDQNGGTVEHVGEARFANISMVNWISDSTIFGLNYGAVVGVPFATGNLNPGSDDANDRKFSLGDIIVTPVSLYGKNSLFDYQFQFSVWTSSGQFMPGAIGNRGSGFWSLIYSVGAVWYPDGDRRDWSLSAIARIEQNFEQAHTGITPGDNFDVDWSIGKMLQLGPYVFDAGVSGFGTWQITPQSGGQPIGQYRYYGIGPEVAAALTDRLGVRVRAQWEFGTRDAVEGNNLWVIVNYRL